MHLKKCTKCGNLFSIKDKNRKLCPKCFNKEREKFIEIRDYLWSNPGANLEELHQKTGVSKKIIQKFIREGRFKKS